MAFSPIRPGRTADFVAVLSVACVGAATHSVACAQAFSPRLLSPAGYTGAINTPTAHVQPWGVANVGGSNSNPESPRAFSQGSFGSLNAGVGLLPGLEAVGRLSYDGDLNCNMYLPSCSSRSRDLSVSAKYQLPLALWNDTRLAVGMTDFGGAATNYRQAYGVATTAWGPAEFSVGYSRSHSPQALMHGVFGSVRYALSPQWHLLAEHDTQERRAGLQYHLPVGDRVALVAGVSRKWTQHSGQQANQLQLAWVFHLDRTTPQPVAAAAVPSSAATGWPSAATLATAPSVTPVPLVDRPTAAPASAPAPAATAAPSTNPEPATASEVAELLKAQGFANIEVKHWAARARLQGYWQITAEPRAYRQSHIEALGHALRPWLDQVRAQRISPQDEIELTLTYQREPVLYAQGQGACLQQWAQGQVCGADTPLQISRTPIVPPDAAQDAALPPDQTAHASAGASWAPQLTLSPALRNTVGTEYGLVDYSLAAQIGTEVSLAKGLFWQGIYLVPVGNSDDYQPGKIFGDSRFQRQWHSSQLSYWKALPLGIQAQVSAGQLTPTQHGSQFDAIWMSESGRWRAGLTSARYRNDQSSRQQLPLFGQLRYSIVPGAWHAEVTAGQFMNGDRGFKLASVHWAGDTRFAVQYQKTASPTLSNMPSRAFMGFTVSFPFGPKAGTAVGPVWLRGQDRWNWGLQTKVGEKDNYLTTGYGEFPRQRQGLWSDVIDHDRNGSADLQAQLPRLRALLFSAGASASPR